MHYQGFDAQITARTNIVRQHWPVDTFCSPHTMPVPELRVLYRVLLSENAPLLFRKLTDVEYEALQAEKTASAQPPSPSSARHDDTGDSPAGSQRQDNPARNASSNTEVPVDECQRRERWDKGMTLEEKEVEKKAREAEKEAKKLAKLAAQAQRRGGRGGRGRGNGPARQNAPTVSEPVA